jgi:hypothetical protein
MKKSYVVTLSIIAAITIVVLFGIEKEESGDWLFDEKISPEPMAFNGNTMRQQENNGLNSQKVVENSIPVSRAEERITKKPFGIFITPETSLVQPERFRGFHTGADFEIFNEEQDLDVSVKAICDGELLQARHASGYGGLAVQSCQLEGKSVTVIYGHIKLSSMDAKIGDRLEKGNFLADLGDGYSNDTDGERKHLHLGIHRGEAVDLRGYVQKKEQLRDWLDPCLSVCLR